MTTPLSEADLQILAVLDEHAGMAGPSVADRLPELDMMTQIRLLGLEERGLVRHIAEPKKFGGCWVRTKAGTEALESAGRKEA